jgi:putative DNA primase/helicase
MISDQLTVLIAAPGKLAAKTFRRDKDGKIKTRNYDQLKFFAVESIEVTGIETLAAALDKVAGNTRAAVVRGSPLPGINRRHTRRLLKPDRKTGDQPTFQEEPRHWCSFDVDHIECPIAIDPRTDPEGAVEHVIGLLPPEFHDCSCYWQFSSSQCVFPDAKDTLSLHLWYWSSEAFDNVALKRWAIATNQAVGLRLIDPALFNPVQIHYVARPAFNGLKDPLPRRSGLRKGLDNAVSILIPPPDPKRPDTPSAAGYEPGAGVEAYLAEIGGPKGFRDPIKSAIGSYVAISGSQADAEPLKERIRDAIARADPGGRSAAEIERYHSDKFLDDLIDWTRLQHGAQAPKIFIAEPPPHIIDPAIPDHPIGARTPELPLIYLNPGQRGRIVDELENALVARECGLYLNAGRLVEISWQEIAVADGGKDRSLQLAELTALGLVDRLSRTAIFKQYLKTEDKWVICDCPKDVAQTYIDRATKRMPVLLGVITAPTLRFDGSLLQTPGYDKRTRIFFDPNGVKFSKIPEKPTKEMAREALEQIKRPFEGYVFEGAGISVALSCVITALLRSALPAAPLHGFDAPLAGSGKTKLFDTASVIATGHRAAAHGGGDGRSAQEESEKKLAASLLAGDTMILLDNMETPLEGQLLNQMLTEQKVTLRPFGKLKNRIATCVALVGATGNQLSVRGDMLRRCLIARLIIEHERPELREFGFDPVELAKNERTELAVAALTIVRAYQISKDRVRVTPLGSFEKWSRLVRQPLIWLDLPDPVDVMESTRAADPATAHRKALMAAWPFAVETTVAKLIQRATDYPDLKAALAAVATGADGALSPERLGWWLRRNKDRVVEMEGRGRCRFELLPGSRTATWFLHCLDETVGG